MNSRALLFLSAAQFEGYVWKDGALLHKQVFADNQDGRSQLAQFLQAHRMPTYLLTDLIEEDFRHETILHLRGRDRAALIHRKFEQFYRNTPFCRATLHQRQQEGRRDDEMLFSALTNPGIIQPWLDILLQQHTPLAGICSVPTISGPLIAPIQADHILLLTWEKHAGLRQTYFNEKRLYLSRLTPVNDGHSFSEAVATEVARTQQYLKSLSLLPLGQTLQILIACHADDRGELQTRLHDTGDIAYSYLDLQEFGAHSKIAEPYQGSDATPLLLHLLATTPPDRQYATAEHTHYYKLWQQNRRMLWLSAMLAAAGLLWSSANLWEGSWMGQDSAALENQAKRLTQRAQQIAQGFSNQVAPAADMKSAVTSLRILDSYAPPPQQIWNGLGIALAQFPRIRLDHLSWRSGSATGIAGTNLATVDPTMPVMVVSGQVEDVNGNFRGALNYLERFEQVLRQHKYQVSAITLPLDVSPKGSIADKNLDSDNNPAPFSLQLTWEQMQ